MDGGQRLDPLAEAERRIQQAIKTGATTLDLSGLKLTTVPESLGNLTNLTELYLYQNQLATIPETLGRLINLQVISLSHNRLKAIPEHLFKLVNLTVLYLHSNQLTLLPESLGNLTNLTELYLSGSKLTTIPERLGNLANLKQLNLSYNQLKTLPESLGNLTALTELYLYQNQLGIIPESLGNLINLTVLDLHQNQLKTLPESLGNLINLTELYLYQNQLKTLPENLGNLKRLTELDLCENQLVMVPESLCKQANLTELYLHNNEQLRIPPQILGSTSEEVRNGATPAKPQDILNYFFRIQADRQPLNEAKLILVGFGAVGKTSLVNRLIHNKFDPNSPKTDGIQITQWPLCLHNTEAIKLHVWDFGGQEIMHSTHQFFLTERSLYLLVLNGRQGREDTDAEYWLELIQSFGADSPIIIVLNKIKEQPFDVNRSALKQKFPAIREFIATDCEAEIGLDQLQAAIERETDQLEHLRLPFPTSWAAVKNRLAEMAANYISFDKYREICQQDGESDFGAQNSLAVHLHNLGIALNYKDDPRLRDTHVLNPHWVTNGIYKLLNAHELAETKGDLALSCLAQILDSQNYPLERHSFLLELMRKFELCFPFPEDTRRYLIPDLLDKQQPEAATAFNLAECLNFRYQYPILPEGLLPRFIVRTHVLSDPKLRWRTGVILEFEGNRALVKADRQDRCVTISINGPLNSRRRILAIIRYDFDRIHTSFKFKPQEQVPIPHHPEVVVSYKELLTREEHQQQTFDVFTGESLLTLNVRDLLNGVDLEGNRQYPSGFDPQNRILRLFYSYSHKDEALRDNLETHLKLLQRIGLIEPWHDRRIMPGTDWRKELDANLEQADIILLLISADFIASEYCYEIEMQRALAKHRAQEAIVLPILLRPVDLQGTPMSSLQGLPTDLQPVTLWPNQDLAWLNVEQGIRKAIEQRWRL